MSHELREGAQLASIIGVEVDGEILRFATGERGVSRIVVAEQNGQMAAVPWARVEFDDQDKPPVLVNLAHIESVQLLPEEA